MKKIILAKTAAKKTQKALYKSMEYDSNIVMIKYEINNAIKNCALCCNVKIKTNNIMNYIRYLEYLGYTVRNIQLPNQINNLFISW